MILLIIGLTLLFISNLIITPVIWCALGKIFRIEDLTFKKALITCLLLTLIGVSLQIIPLGLTFLKINNVVIDLILSIAGLAITISILKMKFNTSILKSIGLYVSTIVFAVCLALLIRTFVVQAFKIPSGAMKSTLLIGDRILVNKYIYKFKSPQRGDIIVFKYPKDPNKDFIKRVIAGSGDIIEIKNKKVYINNDLINENYVNHYDSRILTDNFKQRDNFGPVTVLENSYFVMGDNRDNSLDSRFWGFVESKSIKGKAFIIYWSWNRDVEKQRWNRIGNPL